MDSDPVTEPVRSGKSGRKVEVLLFTGLGQLIWRKQICRSEDIRIPAASGTIQTVKVVSGSGTIVQNLFIPR